MGHFRLAPTKETSAGPCLLGEGGPKKEKKREASKSQPVWKACGSFSAPFLSVCPRRDPRCYVEHEPVKLVIHMYEQRQLSFFPLAFMHALSCVFSLSLFLSLLTTRIYPSYEQTPPCTQVRSCSNARHAACHAKRVGCPPLLSRRGAHPGKHQPWLWSRFYSQSVKPLVIEGPLHVSPPPRGVTSLLRVGTAEAAHMQNLFIFFLKKKKKTQSRQQPKPFGLQVLLVPCSVHVCRMPLLRLIGRGARTVYIN